MQIAYKFKLYPSRNQSKRLDEWQGKIRSLVNLCLAERIDTYRSTFTLGEFCDVRSKGVATPLACSVNKSATFGYFWQENNPSRRCKDIDDWYVSILLKDDKIPDYRQKSKIELNSLLADVICFEKLNIQGMKRRCKPKKCPETNKYLRNGQKAKSQLNQAILDASWYSLRQKTKHQASKLGNWIIEVNPRDSSQEYHQFSNEAARINSGFIRQVFHLSRLVGSVNLVRTRIGDYWLSLDSGFKLGRCFTRSINDPERDGTD